MAQQPVSTVRPARPTLAAEPPLRVLVGSILRTRRERQERTLRDVAESARVSVAYLSEVERGRKEASSEVLVAVCRALGMRLVDLVGEAHAHLAEADGRVVVDLAAPWTAGPNPRADAGASVSPADEGSGIAPVHVLAPAGPHRDAALLARDTALDTVLLAA